MTTLEELRELIKEEQKNNSNRPNNVRLHWRTELKAFAFLAKKIDELKNADRHQAQSAAEE